MIHRDIKGQNVVMGDFGEVMVLDWGLAKVLDQCRVEANGECRADTPSSSQDFEDDASAETDQGEVIGTPSYMSPEQAMGRPDLVDTRSDIYGLGAILYEILTGEPPFRGSKLEVLKKVSRDPPEAAKTTRTRAVRGSGSDLPEMPGKSTRAEIPHRR